MSLFAPLTVESAIEEKEEKPADLHVDDLFAQALREGSNLEMDWLWLATMVVTDGQRSYCLKRALHINPHSKLAIRGLERLRRRPGKPLEF
jgi:hypothetical protein